MGEGKIGKAGDREALDRDGLLGLLRQVKEGGLAPEDALDALDASRVGPFSDLGYAKVDYHRAARQGVGEVIYGRNKTKGQIEGILKDMRAHGSHNVLVTRLEPDMAAQLQATGLALDYRPIPKLAVAFPAPGEPGVGNIVVASAGTSDMPVCEEAAVTAEALGNHVTRLYDVGVAGLHRLLARLEDITAARVVVAVAGMEGALASVIGGLVRCPVIAVPTSVGYGASFGGLSALLSMLNSCANGVAVVNIDNGFGAGYQANLINQGCFSTPQGNRESLAGDRKNR